MPETHHHRWTAVSSHHVSEGLVVYQRCACGQWRVSSTPLWTATVDAVVEGN
jgi:hypothetical protein